MQRAICSCKHLFRSVTIDQVSCHSCKVCFERTDSRGFDVQLNLYGRNDIADNSSSSRLEEEITQTYETEMSLFCSFLCDSRESRDGMSNLLWLWDSLPIWSCEQSNKLSVVPELEVRKMSFEGNDLEITITPGTYELECKETGKSIGKRRYPGQVEMMVEQAIIKLACDQIYYRDDGNKKPVYSVSFSMRQLRLVLKEMQSGIAHKRLREALDVLSTTSVTIRDAKPDASGKRRWRRENILSGFVRLEDAKHNDSDQWSVDLHTLVAKGINEATYRQYRVGKIKMLAPYAVYMLRQMLLTCHALAKENPYHVRLSELSRMSSGLNSARISDNIVRVERELDKMRAEGIIVDFDVNRELERKRTNRRGGRRAILDAIFTLIPSNETISEVKAASKRQHHAEQTLMLPRSKRTERRKSALDGFLSSD